MEKDALCACKDDVALENVRFRQKCFLRLFRERSQLCFDFRVAYSDGLVSRLVKERKNRTPVGIVVKDGWFWERSSEANDLGRRLEILRQCQSQRKGVSVMS